MCVFTITITNPLIHTHTHLEHVCTMYTMVRIKKHGVGKKNEQFLLFYVLTRACAHALVYLMLFLKCFNALKSVALFELN